MPTTELLELSPPILLALALNLVGYALRQSPVPNWLIPFLLMLIGAGTAPFLFTGPGTMAQRILQGLVLGGFAVGLNQAWRQATQGRSADTGQMPADKPVLPPGPS
jgi:hypothetical protein